MEVVKVVVKPFNKTLNVEKGSNLLEELNKANINIEATCGGNGTCGKCKVKVVTDNVPPSKNESKILTLEEIGLGYRLSCRTIVREDLVIEVPTRVLDDLKKSSISKGTNFSRISNSFNKIYLELPHPSIHDQSADLERIIKQLTGRNNVSISLDVLKKIPRKVRKNDFKVTVTLNSNKIIDIEEGNTTNSVYGIAFDIGTTTIVGTLLDLKTGEVLSSSATENPQRSYGADVISRINYCSKENGLDTLKKKVCSGMNKIISDLCNRADISHENVYGVVTVGNTTMQHLFLGVDPSNLARSPYIPSFQRGLTFAANEIGLQVNKNGVVYVAPNIAGFLGADTVSVIIASDLDKSSDIKLAIDIGTNGEIVLGSRDRLIACSTAAGPAFEGAHIQHGMRAQEGAIDKVRIEGDQLQFSTIGEKPAVGICGSGLLDAVARLVKVGIVDSGGRILPPEQLENIPEELVKRIVKINGNYAFIIANAEESGIEGPILLTQKDVRELQLAKGAIYAGIKVLMDTLGVSEEDIEEVIIAGAFGSFINPESALDIGLLPLSEKKKLNVVGNAAGYGAQMLLLSDEQKLRAERITKNIEHIELSTKKEFQTEFMNGLLFS